MKPTLIILCGISGSGKSTLARAYSGALVISTDDFLYEDDGTYLFTSERLLSAISKTQSLFTAALSASVPLIVLDNTNLKQRLIQEAGDGALLAGFEVILDVFQMTQPLSFYERNLHGLPRASLERQAAQWMRVVSTLDPKAVRGCTELEKGTTQIIRYAYEQKGGPWLG